jgi:hypothetical protein
MKFPTAVVQRCLQAKLGGLRFPAQPLSATCGLREPFQKVDHQRLAAEWARGCPGPSTVRALFQNKVKAVQRFPVYTKIQYKAATRVFAKQVVIHLGNLL